MRIKEQLLQYKPYNGQEMRDKEVMLTAIEEQKDVLLRTNEVCHFSASSWIVNQERTKILMAYHNIYQAWSWTGGHCDGCGDGFEVAVREAMEETGLKEINPIGKELFSIEILTVPGHIKRGAYVSAHLHMNCTYLLEADEKECTSIKADENSAIEWVLIEDVVNKAREEEMKPIYQKLNEKLIESL